MTPQELQERFKGLRVDRAHGASARHKPALLAWVVARVGEGHPNAFRFAELDHALRSFLCSALGAGRRTETHMPFWHLRSDGLWEADDSGLTVRAGGKRPTLTATVEANPIGRLPADVYAPLKQNASLRRELLLSLLQNFWGERDHEAVIEALQLHPHL